MEFYLMRFQFNNYTGNFAREWAAYCLGEADQDPHKWTARLQDICIQEEVDGWADNLIDQLVCGYDEYGFTVFQETKNHNEIVIKTIKKRFLADFLPTIIERTVHFVDLSKRAPAWWPYPPLGLELTKLLIEVWETRQTGSTELNLDLYGIPS